MQNETKTDKRLERPRPGLKPIIINNFPMDIWIAARKKSLDCGIPMNKVVLRLISKWLKGDVEA